MAGLVVVAEKVKDPGSLKGLGFGVNEHPDLCFSFGLTEVNLYLVDVIKQNCINSIFFCILYRSASLLLRDCIGGILGS